MVGMQGVRGNMNRRVVVTGLGPVSSIGIGNETFWKNAVQGKGHFGNVDFTDVELDQYRSRVCSPMDGFSLEDHFENPKRLKRAGRATQYTAVGALLALIDAGFKIEQVSQANPEGPSVFWLNGVEPLRCGVILGQSESNVDVMLRGHISFLQNRGPKRVNPITLPQSNCNVGATTVAEWFYLRGTCFTIATACSSATHAIGMATINIQNGIEDIVLTGGADSTLDSYFFSGFDLLRALSRNNDEPEKASRPFDRERDGFVLGEGAGILVLEELGHACKRGARIYGEVIGYGYSTDAYNIVAPDPYATASINAVKKALAMAKISPQEVEYINAHGTSTVLNDPNETYIIKQTFGDYAYKVPISSSKSYFGHTIGAAGGLESIVTCLAMAHDEIPPTSNLENPDVDYVDEATPHLDKRCDLDYVPGVSRKKNVSIALKESFGFGGQNGAVVYKKFEE
jgi:3-oxoacyl-[acyl-carrier-protein] synthase II